MEVLDFQGKIISTITDMIFGKGENKFTQDTQNLNAGIYLINFSNEKETRIHKIIKL